VTNHPLFTGVNLTGVNLGFACGFPLGSPSAVRPLPYK
jgi:hypothetical protein